MPGICWHDAVLCSALCSKIQSLIVIGLSSTFLLCYQPEIVMCTYFHMQCIILKGLKFRTCLGMESHLICIICKNDCTMVLRW